MARAYLGKISALVTANTSDFQAKLNASAKDVRAFASAVQRDIGKASTDAARQLSAIYTPLQRLERAFQAAASQRLSFKGFEGAIRTVEDLRRRLGSLTSREAEVAVRASGLESVSAIRRAIDGIRQDDIDLSVRVGGIEGLRRLRQEVQEVDGRQIHISTGRTAEELDRLIGRFQALSAESIKALSLGLERSQFERVQTAIQRTVSISEQLAKPLSSATQKVAGLSFEVQAEFQPALIAAQRAVENLSAATDANGRITENSFNRSVVRIERTTQAVSRLATATQIAASAAQGVEIGFVAPQVNAELIASAAARNAAAAAPDASQFAVQVQQLTKLNELIVKYQAEVESKRLLNTDTTQAEARLASAIETSRRLRSALEQDLRIRIETDSASRALQSLQQSLADLTGRLSAGSIGEPSDPIERLRRAAAEAQKDIDRLREASVKAGAGSAEADRLASSLNGVVAAASNAASQTESLAEAAKSVDDAVGRVRQVGASAGRQADNLASTPPSVSPPPVSDDLGLPVGATNRQLERLRATIVSTKDQIASLPLPLRQQFIPDIQRAQSEFNRLRNAPSATAEEIELAANELQRLEAGVRRATNAATAFGRTFEDALTGSAISAGQAQLQALQEILLRVGAAAGGPAAAAFDAFSKRIQKVAADGTIALPAVQRELQELINTALRAAAATGKISFSAGRRKVRRAGDEASGAFGNAGLAVQQAVFAIDDFFSVTGDLSQRVRAAGNNISQLGFILGGTTGLIAGVAVAITGQLVAALIKWYSTGASTEAQVKALNDLLAREKTLVEELADSFNRLADSIGDIRVDEQTDALRRQRKELEEIRKKQEEINNTRLFAVDPDVQRERAIQVDLQQQLEQSANAAERITLGRRIAESQDRQRAAEQRAIDRPPAGVDEAAQGIAGSRLAVRLAQIEADVAAEAARAGAEGRPFFDNFSAQATEQAQSDFETQRAQLEEDLNAAGNAAEQAAEAIRLLDEELRRLQDERAGRFFLEDPRVNIERERQIQSLELRRRELERQQFNIPRDEAVRGGRNAAVEAAGQLQQAFDFVAESTRGGGSALRNALVTLQEELEAATTRLKAAQATEGQAGVEAATAAAEEIDAINEKINAELSAAETTKSFADALDRAAFSLLQIVTDESRQAANQARRDANREQARMDLGFATPEDLQFRQRQEVQRRNAERRTERDALEARQRVELERLAFEERARAGLLEDDPAGIEGFEGAAELVRLRDAAAAREQEARQEGNARAELNARLAREEAQLQLDQLFELSLPGRRARNLADTADQAAAREDERLRSIERGRELERTPAERAARDLGDQLLDLQNRLEDRQQGLREGPAIPEEDFQARMAGFQAENDAARQRVIQDSFRAAAPGIFALRDSVENAVLQGPSRAALNAADINTEQGRSELNRLLRGDDPARQADVVELQKQSTLLQTVIDLLREQGIPLVVN